MARDVLCFWYMEGGYSAPGAHEVVWPDARFEDLDGNQFLRKG